MIDLKSVLGNVNKAMPSGELARLGAHILANNRGGPTPNTFFGAVGSGLAPYMKARDARMAAQKKLDAAAKEAAATASYRSSRLDLLRSKEEREKAKADLKAKRDAANLATANKLFPLEGGDDTGRWDVDLSPTDQLTRSLIIEGDLDQAVKAMTPEGEHTKSLFPVTIPGLEGHYYGRLNQKTGNMEVVLGKDGNPVRHPGADASASHADSDMQRAQIARARAAMSQAQAGLGSQWGAVHHKIRTYFTSRIGEDGKKAPDVASDTLLLNAYSAALTNNTEDVTDKKNGLATMSENVLKSLGISIADFIAGKTHLSKEQRNHMELILEVKTQEYQRIFDNAINWVNQGTGGDPLPNRSPLSVGRVPAVEVPSRLNPNLSGRPK